MAYDPTHTGNTYTYNTAEHWRLSSADQAVHQQYVNNYQTVAAQQAYNYNYVMGSGTGGGAGSTTYPFSTGITSHEYTPPPPPAPFTPPPVQPLHLYQHLIPKNPTLGEIIAENWQEFVHALKKLWRKIWD